MVTLPILEHLLLPPCKHPLTCPYKKVKVDEILYCCKCLATLPKECLLTSKKPTNKCIFVEGSDNNLQCCHCGLVIFTSLSDSLFEISY